ncbi:MAG: D-sedoheptulose 7-phosphate isomerase [Candidatus Mcinerneyibacterium aminivorans]|uniref:Phosphoheptose isomerase n=1 Tax=Candidatus Mcinerneyibacterium aminivorans TaxID=2703815 RepID=A0A5D0MDQ7_9BACT|nr:MAG: D-sedoheptulose 7-phosphate isomerase [Candidatus Mcinerneyibacterium aminivorans]
MGYNIKQKGGVLKNNKEHISNIINKSIMVSEKILNKSIIEKISRAGDMIIDAYRKDHKVLLCGNGGSAADAQHIAAELSGKFYRDRPPLYAEALHVNTSYLTAVSNDYSFDIVFERLVQGMGKKGDILIGLSTSGNSKNVVNAIKKASEIGMKTIGLTGETGGKMKDITDLIIRVPSNDTPRIQEVHILIGHIICQIVEKKLFDKNCK